MIETFKKLPRWLQLSFLFPLLFLNGFLLAILLNYLQPLIDFLLIASLLAFLLELLVDLLEKKGIKRTYAIAGVIVFAILNFTVIGLFLIPLMVQQLGDLVKNVPEWITQTNDFFISNLSIFEKFSIDIEPLIAEAKSKLATVFQSIGSKTLELIISTITSVFNALFIFILTIFLLVAGDKFWQGFFSWFPSPWSEKIPQYLQKTFKDYFFVRLILTGISSVARLIVFLILGVPYSTLFAFGIGIGGLIPFVGGIVTLFGAIILIFKSGTLAIWFFIAAAIIDQLTDSVLAPRLMGDAIGLNPIWLIISLFIGAKVGGLLGVFLAVPLASVIKQIAEDLLSPVSPVSDSPELVNNE